MQTLKNRLYFRLKPFLPLWVRMTLRQAIARKVRKLHEDTWPINESAGRLPPGWPGWPEGKQMAVVLTHDVEGLLGLAKCRKLAQLEKELGFRSSFNFVPEGEYLLPDDLREDLTREGFEIGVHDLFHDGKLYSSLEAFQRHARAINGYMAKWDAVGYRSGFMLHNYDWHHLLDVLYDASSFDTDPFEPQPDGVGTIFPFWVPNRGPGAVRNPDGGARPLPARFARDGYAQLPYTLPQDSTMFLVLKEKSPEIWFRKLEWIARQRGMALLGVHPDYIQFEGESANRHTFPVAHYRQLLEHIRDRYAGAYWQPLPREVGQFVHHHRDVLTK